MTGAPAILLYLLLLILPIAALVARRVPRSTVIRYAAIWAGIFATGAVVLTLIQ